MDVAYAWERIRNEEHMRPDMFLGLPLRVASGSHSSGRRSVVAPRPVVGVHRVGPAG
jgi:hypothetical protein